MARLRQPQPRPNPTPIRRPDNRVSAPPGNINQHREPKPAAPEASRSSQGKGPRRGVIGICRLFRLNVCLQMKPCVARRGQHRLRGIGDVARRCTGAHFAFRTALPGPRPAAAWFPRDCSACNGRRTARGALRSAESCGRDASARCIAGKMECRRHRPTRPGNGPDCFTVPRDRRGTR